MGKDSFAPVGLQGTLAAEAHHHAKGYSDLELGTRLREGKKYGFTPLLALLGAGMAGMSAGAKAGEGDFSGAAKEVGNFASQGGLDIGEDVYKGNYKDAAVKAADIGSYFLPAVGPVRTASDLGSLAGTLARAGYDTFSEPDSVFKDEIEKSEAEQEANQEAALKAVENIANQKVQRKQAKFQQLKDIMENK